MSPCAFALAMIVSILSGFSCAIRSAAFGSPGTTRVMITDISASSNRESVDRILAGRLLPMATIVHFELPSADVDRAKAFWSGVFGWTFGGMTEPFVYLMTEGEEPVGAIYQDDDQAGKGP